MADAKIVGARLEKGEGEWDATKIFVTFEDPEGQEIFLRDFFDDEIYVNPMNLLGKTEEEARDYIRELDIAYLRS